MKTIATTISLEHNESITLLTKQEPEMEDRITIPLYGVGIVSGLNDNYKGTDQTWIMVSWQDSQETDQFRYILEA